MYPPQGYYGPTLVDADRAILRDGIDLFWVSNTELAYTAGWCYDTTGKHRIAVSEGTIDITTDLNTEAPAGTWAASGGTTATGTGTDLLTKRKRRALTGTFSGGDAGASSVITGSGSNAKVDRVHPGMLIGTDAAGYNALSAVEWSDAGTNAAPKYTVNTAFASAFSGATLYVIENDTFEINSEHRSIERIASDTSLVATAAWGTWTGQTGRFGAETAGRFVYPIVGADGTVKLANAWSKSCMQNNGVDEMFEYMARLGVWKNNSSSNLIPDYGRRAGMKYQVIGTGTYTDQNDQSLTPERVTFGLIVPYFTSRIKIGTYLWMNQSAGALVFVTMSLFPDSSATAPILETTIGDTGLDANVDTVNAVTQGWVSLGVNKDPAHWKKMSRTDAFRANVRILGVEIPLI